MELWVRKTVECIKHCLMGHTSWSMGDNGAGVVSTVGAQLKRRLLLAGLETISVIFWQIKLLLFVLHLKVCGMLY